MKRIKFFVTVLLIFSTFAFLIACGSTEGNFYTLSEAYEKGWLTKDDLKNISFYHSGRVDENFIPAPKEPESLSSKQINGIKETYLRDVLDMPEGSKDRIVIWNYYGTYKDSIAVGVTDNYYVYDKLVEPEYTVGGVTFYNFAL